MGTASRISALLLLPAIALFEGLAWYGARTVLTPHLLEGGMTREELGISLTVLLAVGAVGTIFGALFALPIGAWVPLPLGALIAMVGLGLLAAAPPDVAVVMMGVAAFGHGVMRPAVWGAGAQALGREHENLRVVLFVGLYVAMNIAGLASGALGSSAVDAGAAPVLGVAAGLSALALLLAIALTAVVLVARRRERPPATPARFPHLAAVLVLTLMLGMAWATTTWAWDLPYTLAGAFDGAVDMAGIMRLNSIAVIVFGVLVAAVFGVLQLVGKRFPWLVLAGLGLVLAAVSMIALLLQDPAAPSGPALLFAMVLLGVAEILVVPLVLARLTGELPFRLETLVVALWFLIGQAPSVLRRMSESPDSVRSGAWAGAVMLVLFGLALVPAAFPLRRAFDSPRGLDG